MLRSTQDIDSASASSRPASEYASYSPKSTGYGSCDNRIRDAQDGTWADQSMTIEGNQPQPPPQPSSQQPPFPILAPNALAWATQSVAPQGDHPLPTPNPTAPLPPRNDSEDDEAVLPQEPYAGNRRPVKQFGAAALRESIPINVPASVALQPDVLVRVLANPLSPAFKDRGVNSGARKGQKFTVRFAFQVAGHKKLVNKSPAQMHEYAGGFQNSSAVEAAWNLQGEPLSKMTAKIVRLKRAALVERVAITLRDFLNELKAQGTPLVFRGREVQYEHILIISLSRPTGATVQPKLAILSQYKNLYPA